MASQTLEIIIQARNLADKELKAASGGITKLSDGLKAHRAQLLAVAGVVGGIGIAAIKLASDLEEARAAAETTFGDASAVVTEFAESTAADFNITKAAAFEYTAQLGAIFKASGLSTSAAAEQSVEFTKLAADLASFKNLRFEDALQKIRAGLVGEAEPLRQVGVLLSEAKVQQVAYAAGIAEAGEKLTDAQKVSARQIIIMDELADAQGDVSRTAGSFANQMKNLQQELADAGAELGTQLLPHVSRLLGLLAAAVKWFGALDKEIKTAILVLGGVVLGLAALGLAIPVVIALISAMGVAFNLALGGIPLLIAAAVTAGFLLIKNWDTVKEAVRVAVNVVLGLIEQFVNAHLIGINLIIRGINLVLEFLGKDAIPEIRLQLGRWEKALEDVGEAHEELESEVEKRAKAIQERAKETAQAEVDALDFAERSRRKSIEVEQALINQQIADRFVAQRKASNAERAAVKAAEDEKLAALTEAADERAELDRAETKEHLRQLEARAAAEERDISRALADARELAGIRIVEAQRGVSSAGATFRGQIAAGGGLETEAQAEARLRARGARLGLGESQIAADIEANRGARNRLLTGIGTFAPLPSLTGPIPGINTVNITFAGNVTANEAVDELERSLRELQETGRMPQGMGQ